jgi:hypothetical protein
MSIPQKKKKKTEEESKMVEIDSMEISNKPKDNDKKVDTDPNNLPEEEGHFEKYQYYYLIFGSFFFTVLIILISNWNTNNEIQKINSRLSNPYSENSSQRNTNEILNIVNRQAKNEHGQTSKFEVPKPD